MPQRFDAVAHPDPWRQSSLHKPRYRGLLHKAMIPISGVVGAILVVTAPTFHAALLGGIFALSVTTMFVTSWIFNAHFWSDRVWIIMRQIDQSAIYFLIGGAYTALVGLSLDGWPRAALLAGVWFGIAAGLFLRWMPFALPHGVQTGLFITLGWLAVLAIPALWRESAATTTVILASGLLYTVGAAVLGLRRPDPWPMVFGYHEIWHVMVVGAVALDYVAVFRVVSEAS
ncbi:MAG: hemolysin III family protein [Acidimicrobiia bacterium]|nr:hemolysin III family protein [Acidimicrobiia bacterium]